MNSNARSGLMALAGGYLLYLAWEMVQGMKTGESTMAPGLTIAFCALFVLGGIAVIVYAYLIWKKSRSGEEEREQAEKKDQSALK